MTTTTAKSATTTVPKILKGVTVPGSPPDRTPKVPDTTKSEKSESSKPAKPAKKSEPAKKSAEKRPDHLRTVKGREQQRCAGACGKWKALDDFARKSAARGGGPIRRCKSCIAEERKATKTKTQG